LSQPEHARCSRCEQRFRNGRVDINILFLAQLLPYPLDSGGKIKSYHFLQALAEKHSVTLVSFVRSEQEVQSAGALKHFCDRTETVRLPRSALRDARAFGLWLLRRKSFIVTRDHPPEMEAMVPQVLSSGRYDAVHLDHLQMAQFLRHKAAIVKILDEHNAEWCITKRLSQTEPATAKKTFAARH
jgi:hypothetical protein